MMRATLIIVFCCLLFATATLANAGDREKRGGNVYTSPLPDSATTGGYDWWFWWWFWWDTDDYDTSYDNCPEVDEDLCYCQDYCYITYDWDGCAQCVCDSPTDGSLQSYLNDMLGYFAEEAETIARMAQYLRDDITYVREYAYGVDTDNYYDYYDYYKRASENLKKRRISRDLHLTRKRRDAMEKKESIMRKKRDESAMEATGWYDACTNFS